MATATTAAPRGFKPVRVQNGGAWTGQTSIYRITNAYATSIFMYDPVWLDTITGAVGTIKKLTAGTPSNGTSTMPVGIFMGCQYIDSTGKVNKSPYWPASTSLLGSNILNCEAYVVDDPNIIFQAQFSNAGAAETGGHTQADVGQEYNIVASSVTSVSTATGLSCMSVDYAATASSGKQVKLVTFRIDPQLDYTGSNAIGEFVFAAHAFKAAI